MPEQLTITNRETIRQVLELEQHPLLKGRDRNFIISRAIEKYFIRKNAVLEYKNSKWRRMSEILRSQGYACAYCGRPLNRRNATIDHRVPIVHGGEMNDPANQVASCAWCNNEKGDMEEADFFLYLRSKNTWNETHPEDKRQDEHNAALHERALRSNRPKAGTILKSTDEQGADGEGGVAPVPG